MIRPERIGHVVIKVRDLERSARFNTEVMGLQIMKLERGFKMGFFASNGRDHHEIAAMEVGSNAPVPPPRTIGRSHIAFRLRDEEHLRAAYNDLKSHEGKIVAAINHGVTKSVYSWTRMEISSKSIVMAYLRRSPNSPTHTREWKSSILLRMHPTSGKPYAS